MNKSIMILLMMCVLSFPAGGRAINADEPAELTWTAIKNAYQTIEERYKFLLVLQAQELMADKALFKSNQEASLVIKTCEMIGNLRGVLVGVQPMVLNLDSAQIAQKLAEMVEALDRGPRQICVNEYAPKRDEGSWRQTMLELGKFTNQWTSVVQNIVTELKGQW